MSPSALQARTICNLKNRSGRAGSLLFLCVTRVSDVLPGIAIGLISIKLCKEKALDDLVFRASFPGGVVEEPNGAADGSLVEGAGAGSVTKCPA